MRHVIATRMAAITCFLCIAPLVHAEYSGSLGLNYAHRLDDSLTTEAGTIGKLKYEQDWDLWAFRAEGRARYNDAACNHNYSQSSCDAYRTDSDWRELYLTYNGENWQTSLGWQQVVWGRADNLRVLDLVNPLDYREFVLPDLNDYRRASPMLKINHQLDEWSLEAVFLPRFIANRYAVSGSEFDFHISEQFAQQGMMLAPDKYPDGGIQQSEAGLIASTTRGSIDYSLMMLSAYNDDPVYGYTFSKGDAISVVPSLRRQHTLGGSLAAGLDGGWVLRSETTWTPDSIYSAETVFSPLRRADTFTGLMGLDYSWRDWLLTGQAMDRYISGWQTSFLVPEHAATLTLSATGNTFDARLTTRVALTLMPQNSDGQWWQFKSAYHPNDDWSLEAELDLLRGGTTGYFGQFADQDRVRLELKRLF